MRVVKRDRNKLITIITARGELMTLASLPVWRVAVCLTPGCLFDAIAVCLTL